MKPHEKGGVGTETSKNTISPKEIFPQNITQKLWYLERLMGSDKKKDSIMINKFPFHIGRNEDCELLLPSKYISKYHAEIVREGNVIKIVDLGSVNGIFINRKKVQESTILNNGDTLHFNKLFDDKLAFKVIRKNPHRAVTESKSQVAKGYGNQINNYFKARKQVMYSNDFQFSIGLPLFLEIKARHIIHLKAQVFSWNQRDSLTVDLSPAEEGKIELNDKCAIRFSYDGKIFGFESVVTGKEEELSSPRLTFKYPKKITCIAYRKHTRYQTNLKAVMRQSFKDRLISCRITNISLGGCCVVFSPETRPELEKEVFLTIVNLVNDLRVLIIHEKNTPSGIEMGLKFTSFGGAVKKKKYEEILNFHAPVNP